MDPKSQARIDHVKGKIRSPQLLTIASKLKLSLHSGEVIELQSLCQPGRNRILTDNCLYGPADHLAVGHCTGVVLPHLFLPGTVAYPSPSGPEAVLVTEATQTLVRGVSGPVHLLRRLVEYKQCGAYKMLESSGRLAEVRLAADELSDQKPHTGVAAAIQRAVFEMHSSIRLLSTSYLLVALADEPVLSSAGLSRQQLTPLLLEWAEFEGRQELLEVSPWAAADPKTTFDVKVSLVWSYLYSARFEEARRLTRSDLCVGPRRQLGLMLLGLAESLSGDLETGLQHFSEAAQLSSESVYATCCAESLMWLGRIDEAREACPTGDDQYTLTIRASLADSPEECLRLCDQAEQAGPGQYFELAEARGQAYFKLGRKSEARECFSRFLQARRDNSMLDHFEARMDRARRLLES